LRTHGPLIDASTTAAHLTATAGRRTTGHRSRGGRTRMRVCGKFGKLLFKIVARAIRTLGLFRTKHYGLKLLSAALANVFKNRHFYNSFTTLSVRETLR
jgi:hypothetical protein